MKYPVIYSLVLIAGTGFVYLANSDVKKGSTVLTNRSSQYPVLDVILQRWSPRAMSGEKITQEELMTIFEAGRWAPSSYNNQPWHFIYGMRDTQAWETLFSLLVPFNQSWCVNGAALVCVVSSKKFIATGKPSRTNLADTGSAWANMTLQATSMGLVSHGIEGFDYQKAAEILQIPEDYDIVLMFVIGRPAPASTLPEALAEREKPSDRVPLEQIISEGTFVYKRK